MFCGQISFWKNYIFKVLSPKFYFLKFLFSLVCMHRHSLFHFFNALGWEDDTVYIVLAISWSHHLNFTKNLMRCTYLFLSPTLSNFSLYFSFSPAFLLILSLCLFIWKVTHSHVCVCVPWLIFLFSKMVLFGLTSRNNPVYIISLAISHFSWTRF